MADAPIPPTELFSCTNREIQQLQESINNPSSSTIYKSMCQSIFNSLISIRDDIHGTTPYALDIIESILEKKRQEVGSGLSLKEVQALVPKVTLKGEFFPSYADKNYVKGYQVTRCVDPTISALIYPRFLAVHGRYLNNDQI